jgi:hypothetical protein
MRNTQRLGLAILFCSVRSLGIKTGAISRNIITRLIKNLGVLGLLRSRAYLNLQSRLRNYSLK